MPLARSNDNVLRTTLALGEVLVDATSGERFRVTGFIGKGGMGEVYLGEAESGGGAVAIKTIPLALADDPKIALRTRFESDALRELRHRNVVPVYASGVRADGMMFMVMRYLSGMTFLELRRTLGRIPIAWSLEIVRDACRGLLAIHEHAVHRDVKPANLHFGIDAVVRVLDLGAAKWKRSGMRLTSAGTQLGTLAYMAPEALDDSAPIDAQADLWSAGVVLYELLADRHPFAFDGRLPDNPFVLGNRILDEPHLPLRDVAPLCPGYLTRIVDKALAKDPRDRHGSAAELAQALSEAMRAFEHEHGAAPPLVELAEKIFPDTRRRAAAKNVSHLGTTAPLDPEARRVQPTALPYIRTAEIPPSIVAAAERGEGKQPPRAAEAPALGAQAVQGARPSDPEPPRVSDVYPKRPRVAPTLQDLAASPPAPVREGILPGADAVMPLAQRSSASQLAPPPGTSAGVPARKRGAIVAGAVLVVVAAGVAAAGLSWCAGVEATPHAADAAAPSASPRRNPGARPTR